MKKLVAIIGMLIIATSATSGKNANGKNAITKVAVHPTTAAPICLVPFKIASVFECPSLSHRSMFSTTTILSSTNNHQANDAQQAHEPGYHIGPGAAFEPASDHEQQE